MPIKQQVRNFLKKSGIRPKKRLGQNFLIDEGVLERIISAADVTDDDLVLEIGAGLGHLTAKLAEVAKRVIAVELDDVLFAEIQPIYAKTPNVELIQADILKIDLSELLQSDSREHTKVVANLPYYITTPILLKLLGLRSLIQTCVLMMQEEVAQRIVAPAGNRTYGSLSVFVDYHAEPAIVFKVPATSFYPSPKVDSALLLLKMREKPKCPVKSEELFFRVVRGAFQHRRKTLRNSLIRSGLSIPSEILDTAFKRAQIDSQRRGETLNIAEFADLVDCLHEILKSHEFV
ncbi:MAG: 16S rRNA (adenine(1518)-N(6)/adenine(1519)-N(6))-dimethyltransferase RsmA [Candidatus Poribacteria bacterium]